ncbi:fimbria/pilus periplasmic chaperone [Enterobacteriaceae bacterium 4M9]|nr:fimbria/pilus periplasmic chaperone [Enterobacteriaceae bacterium 4M9]
MSLLKHLSVIVLSLAISTAAIAGGVGVGSTRVIYQSDAKQASLSVNNTDSSAVFLIQSWIEDANSKKTDHFVLTPPLFVIQPSKENVLRILFSGPQLPQDRETLYWINVKAIPTKGKDNQPDSSTLQFAIVSKLKLFYRPTGLPLSSDEAMKQLSASQNGSTLTFKNPTPYYINVANIKSGNTQLKTRSVAVAPFSTSQIDVESSAKNITYQLVNDYGGLEPSQPVK